MQKELKCQVMELDEHKLAEYSHLPIKLAK